MLRFEKEVVTARFISPSGATVQAPIEIRTNPISGRTCRVAFSRIGEREAGTDFLPAPPPFAGDTSPSARFGIDLLKTIYQGVAKQASGCQPRRS
ncbi:MAG TPA: hypothetical protein VLR50_20150 [Desulfobacterales bacterium]|nr:hypothetical protein [Desulfobacterales bacterium]